MYFILDTGERLGFTQVLQMLEPQSPQGRKTKKAIKPFLPGQEAEFDLHVARLKYWLKVTQKTAILEKVRPLLKELKQIDGILERLAEGLPLDEGECFEVKANLAVTRKIIKGIETELRLSDGLSGMGNRMVAVKCDLSRMSTQTNAESGIDTNMNLNDDTLRDSQSSEDEKWHWEEMLNCEPIWQLNPLDSLWALFNPGEMETDRFYLRDEYDAELAKIRQEIGILQREIKDETRARLVDLEQLLGRAIPASGEIMVSKSEENLIAHLEGRGDWRIERETFSAYFFKYISGPTIKTLEEKLTQLQEEEERIVARVLVDLSKQILVYLPQLEQNQESLGELDWMLTRVEFAIAHHCVPPERSGASGSKHQDEFHEHERLTESRGQINYRKNVQQNCIQITGGRHLLVEREVVARGSEYTPIDITVCQGVTVITGSNMGGKTLNLRMVGLLTAMAQHGLCVPAERMRFSLRQFMYFSVDDDQTKGDLSTFGQEIVGLNQALPRRDEPGLILIDELARGTNPEEGSALGRAIVKYLLDSPAITVLTTHFAALAQVKGVCHFKVVGLNKAKYEFLQNHYHEEEFSLKMINKLMDYRLVEAGVQEEISRDAIRVAALLGLEYEIIQTAEEELDHSR